MGNQPQFRGHPKNSGEHSPKKEELEDFIVEEPTHQQKLLRARAIEIGEAVGWVEKLKEWRAKKSGDYEKTAIVTRECLAKCPTWILEALNEIWPQKES